MFTGFTALVRRTRGAMPGSGLPLRRTAPALLCLLALLTSLAPSTATAAPAESAQAAAAPPRVIPALRTWQPAPGAYHFDRHTRVLTQPGVQSLHATARTLAAELETRYGGNVPVITTTRPAKPGDVVLTLSPERNNLGDEGYQITVGESVRIDGASDDGVFYGTRTLLQMLANDRTAPAGSAVDVPRYPDRGLTLGLYRYSMPRIKRILQDMAYLKLNYLLLEIRVDSDTHPEVVRWPYYTKREARQIQRWAEKYHVTLIPEVNAPGHMGPYLFNHPELQLTDKNGNPAPGRLDITNPRAFDFYTDLIDEWSTIFDGPYWHLGADEYMWGSSYANFPQIGEWAKQQFGPDALPQDAFIHFVNSVDDYVNSLGMTLRMWNDGIPEHSTLTLHSDIVIEHWKDDKIAPSTLLQRGHSLMNAASALYHNRGNRVSGTHLCGDVPIAQTTLEGCVAKLWTKSWDPGQFEGENIAPDTPGLRGAKISLWPGPGPAQTENSVEDDMFMPLRFLAQRTWGSSDPFISYETFQARAQAVGHAPGWGMVDYRPVSDGTYVLRNLGARALAEPDPEPGSAVTTALRPGTWQLHHTEDGYYRIVSATTGLCLDTRVGRRYLGAPMEPGSEVTAERCDDRNTQKWEVLRRKRGPGFTITNAISRLAVDVHRQPGRHDPVTVMPAHQAEHGRWFLIPRGKATVTVDPSRDLLERGQQNTVHVTFTNHGMRSATNVALEMQAPHRWQVRPESATHFDAVASGESVTAIFSVRPPVSAEFSEDYLLQARARYDARRQHTISGATSTRVDLTTCTSTDPVDPDDQFDGESLNGCRWTRVLGGDPTGIEMSNGKLRIQTRYTSVAGPGTHITNVPLQQAPEGSWTATIKMHAPLSQRYQLGGLMVYENANDFVVFDVVADNPAGEPLDPRLELISEQDGQYGNGGWVNAWTPPANADDTWWLQITKSDSTFSAAYSVDGKTWVDMPGSVTNPMEDPQVGLLATQDFHGDSITVSFDSFQMSTP